MRWSRVKSDSEKSSEESYEETSPHRRGPRGIGSGVAMCAPGDCCRTVRNAAGAHDSRPPDGRLRGTSLLEFPEVRERKHRALAAEGRDAPRGISVAGDRAGDCGTRGTRSGCGPGRVFAEGDRGDLPRTAHHDSP